jgi:hypothetical protein
LAGEVKILNMKGTPEDWQTFADKLTVRNTALGLIVPEAKEGAVAVPVSAGTFAIAQGFLPMHHLAKRAKTINGKLGIPLFPEERRQFYELRTPLNWAVGLALFSLTSEKSPGNWQETDIQDLEDRVFCLTERDAPRRGDHRSDILTEVVKLHTTHNWYVRYNWKQTGRVWKRTVTIGSNVVIPEFELEYIDKTTGDWVLPSNPAFRKLVIPFEVKGRRAYTPDGKDIPSLPSDRFRLKRIRWRWLPSFVDDLLAGPAVDEKGKIKKDSKGNILRGGFNIQVAVRIFDALAVLRKEKAYIAHDLLILLASDILGAAKSNVIERNAEKLFDRLGLEYDPKHKGRREEAVGRAIFRLKQPDIGALLPLSDEYPREAKAPKSRHVNPLYRLIRSSEFMPPAALSSKEDALANKAEGEAAPEPLALPDPKTKVDQIALPGLVEDAPSIPSGADIRAAREAAGVNLRDFARMMDGPAFKTWSNYETGKPIRVDNIKAGVWDRVRDFLSQHGKKES